MESTKAPWTSQRDASTSHFPQLARPGLPVEGIPPGNVDTMSPTAAPWAEVPSSTQPRQHRTGSLPVLVQAEPEFPKPKGLTASPGPATKRIQNEEDLKLFLQSSTLRSFVAFILALNESVLSKKTSDPIEVSDPVQKLLNVLTVLCQWVDEIPPVQQSLRYGNPAYRTWFARMVEHSETFMKSMMPEALHPAAPEVASYFADSFGNSTRIDYGTGHETTFAALLYVLAQLGVFCEEDRQALVTKVFNRYIQLMRKVQTTYWLEPAGSHGVWGLDDYQFLPFIWGSAQLVNHPLIRPKSVHNPEVLEMYADDYMYLGCIKFVKEVKKGPLPETSPIINDISGVPTWSKVNSGMIKMYQAEVLAKFPIMQHFLFGSMLTFD